jgi:hypothetical protein
MEQVETRRFTVGVFQDIESARKALEALRRHGFPAESLTVLGKADPDLSSLIEHSLGAAPLALTLRGVGETVARGPLLEALGGPERNLGELGLAATMRRVGFQAHDGFIFETLTGRGGILVAIQSEPRAADALAVLHAYGGGNAAIGAWTDRV